MVEEGEPEWLPEDRDIVSVFIDFEWARLVCGHWKWDEPPEDMEPGYVVCKRCAVLRPYEEHIRAKNRDRGEDEHGLTFGFFPLRPED